MRDRGRAPAQEHPTGTDGRAAARPPESGRGRPARRRRGRQRQPAGGATGRAADELARARPAAAGRAGRDGAGGQPGLAAELASRLDHLGHGLCRIEADLDADGGCRSPAELEAWPPRVIEAQGPLVGGQPGPAPHGAGGGRPGRARARPGGHRRLPGHPGGPVGHRPPGGPGPGLGRADRAGPGPRPRPQPAGPRRRADRPPGRAVRLGRGRPGRGLPVLRLQGGGGDRRPGRQHPRHAPGHRVGRPAAPGARAAPRRRSSCSATPAGRRWASSPRPTPTR